MAPEGGDSFMELNALAYLDDEVRFGVVVVVVTLTLYP